MATMTQHQTLTPAADYETVRAAIAYLSETGAEDVDLAALRPLARDDRAAARPTCSAAGAG